MKANKRVRDLKRRRKTHLFYIKEGKRKSTTAMPTEENKIQQELKCQALR